MESNPTISGGVAAIRSRLSSARNRFAKRSARTTIRRLGGEGTVVDLAYGFRQAEEYRPWDRWSLDQVAIMWVVELIVSGRIRSIVEFGAGYSTIALSHFIARGAREVTLTSIEHQVSYFHQLSERIAHDGRTRMVRCDLMQLSDEQFDLMFEIANPQRYFVQEAKMVEEHLLGETRLRNAFYRLPNESFKDRSIDLVILDGPNGNGRSLAFPLLRDAIRFPAYVLVDDYKDYDFLEKLAVVFSVDDTRLSSVEGKNKALVRISGLKRSSGGEGGPSIR